MRTNKRYGWVPDLPDQRDQIFQTPKAVMVKMPAVVDLRPKCAPVVDQNGYSACTACAIGSAFHFGEKKQKDPDPIVPSRCFIYFNEREIEGTTSSDSGAQIRDGIKTVVKQGVCDESLWAYSNTNLLRKPPAKCYQQALNHQVVRYLRVNQNLNEMCGCLAAGYPFVFGFTVYSSFESDQVAKTGIVPMPKPDESVVGGHCMLCVGFCSSHKVFLVQNSWGKWGEKQSGFCRMPYTYLANSNLASDFWTIRLVEV